MSEGVTFGRILAALPTPFDERGKFDAKAMDLLVAYFADRRMSGFAVLTEAGEGAFLESSERRAVVERVARRAEGKRPFWVQISEPWTRGAVEAAQHAEGLGAEGLLIGLERLPGVGYPEMYRHLDRLGQAVTTRLVLVVRPGDLVSGLAPEEQATLGQHPRLSGVFLAEGYAPTASRAWTKRLEGRGEVLGACSFEIVDSAKSGVSGVVCALALLAPEPARAMMDGFSRGELDGLAKLRRRMAPAVDQLGPPRPDESRGGVERLAERIARRSLDGGRLRPWAPPGLLKEGLRLQGHRLNTFVRPPQPQVTSKERERLKSLMKACGMLG